MSERDPIYTDGRILSKITNLSLLSSSEKSVLQQFQIIYSKCMNNWDVVHKYSRSNDEIGRNKRNKALDDISKLELALYDLLDTDEINHILDMNTLGKFASHDMVSDKSNRAHFIDAYGGWLHWEKDALTPVNELVVESVMFSEKYFRKHNTYIGFSKLTAADTLVFITFITRAILISNSPNKTIAERFDEDYVKAMRLATSTYYTWNYTFDNFFNNRFGFYDSIFASYDNIKDKVNALIEEFEYIIKTDIIKKEFVEFSSASPLPILPFGKDFECRAEVQTFYNEYMRAMQGYIKTIQNNLKSIYFSSPSTDTKSTSHGVYSPQVTTQNCEEKSKVEPKSAVTRSIESNQQLKNRYCRKCGAALLPDSNYCDQCGKKVISNNETCKRDANIVKKQENDCVINNLGDFLKKCLAKLRDFFEGIFDTLSDIPVLGPVFVSLIAIVCVLLVIACATAVLIGLWTINFKLGVTVFLIGADVIAYLSAYKWKNRKPWIFWAWLIVSIPTLIGILIST